MQLFQYGDGIVWGGLLGSFREFRIICERALKYFSAKQPMRSPMVAEVLFHFKVINIGETYFIFCRTTAPALSMNNSGFRKKYFIAELMLIIWEYINDVTPCRIQLHMALTLSCRSCF